MNLLYHTNFNILPYVMTIYTNTVIITPSYSANSTFFPSIFYTIAAFSLLYGELRRAFFPSEWCFSTLRPRAGLLTAAYSVRIQSINQINTPFILLFSSKNMD